MVYTGARRGEANSRIPYVTLPEESLTHRKWHKRKEPIVCTIGSLLNQQLPILPGRFQPSTFGVCELNYRVRHGYGCILTAIATESESLFSQNYIEEVPSVYL